MVAMGGCASALVLGRWILLAERVELPKSVDMPCLHLTEVRFLRGVARSKPDSKQVRLAASREYSRF